MSDRSEAEISTSTRSTYERQTSIFPGEILTPKPSKLAAADPPLRPRGYRDRPRDYV
jgi:hypothetical protein